MTTYGLDRYGSQPPPPRYYGPTRAITVVPGGAPVPLISNAYLIDPFVATPVDYSSILVTWASPDVTTATPMNEFRLLSNRYGFSVDENDGDILFDVTSSPPTSYLDQNVIPGQMHYYSFYILGQDTAGQTMWIRAGFTACLMPTSYNSGARLLSLLPEYMQDLQDYELTASNMTPQLVIAPPMPLSGYTLNSPYSFPVQVNIAGTVTDVVADGIDLGVTNQFWVAGSGNVIVRYPDTAPAPTWTWVNVPVGNVNPYLQQFLNVAGWALDYMQTQYDFIFNTLNNPLTMSLDQVVQLAGTLGVPFQAEIPAFYMRQAVANWSTVMKMRGSVPGISEEISLLTGYGADIQTSRNIMLENDQSLPLNPLWPAWSAGTPYDVGEMVSWPSYPEWVESQVYELNNYVAYNGTNYQYIGNAPVGTYFGAFLNLAEYDSSTGWPGALSQWNEITDIPLNAARWYAGTSYGWNGSLVSLAAAGTRICLDLTPAYDPVSSDDLAGIESMLQAAKAAGADVLVSLWHEPYYGGLTAAQFQEVISYYGPTVRQYYPLYACFSGNDTVEANGYYPPEGSIDGISVDDYATSLTSLTNAEAVANDYGIPLGLWEFNAPFDLGMIQNGTASPVSGITLAESETFLSGITTFFQQRLEAGLPNGDILLFSQGTNTSTGTGNWLGDAYSQLGGFEGGIGTWETGAGATVAGSTAEHHSGSSSLAVAVTTAGTIGVSHCSAAQSVTDGMPVVAGQECMVSCWGYSAASGVYFQPGVKFYDSSGTYVSAVYATAQAATAGAWVFAGGSGLTCPSEAVWAVATVQITSAVAGTTYYIDDVQMCIQPSGTVDHTAPVQYPWDYRISYLSEMQQALNGTSTDTAKASSIAGIPPAGATDSGAYWAVAAGPYIYVCIDKITTLPGTSPPAVGAAGTSPNPNNTNWQLVYDADSQAPYTSASSYSLGESVVYEGNRYLCVVDSTTAGTAPSGTTESTTDWAYIDAAGGDYLTISGLAGGENTWEVLSATEGSATPDTAAVPAATLMEGIGVHNPLNFDNDLSQNSFRVTNRGTAAQDMWLRSVSRQESDITAASAVPDPQVVVEHAIPVPQPGPEWNSAIRYGTGDLVTYSNLNYLALRASTGIVPGTSAAEWEQLGNQETIPLMVSAQVSQDLSIDGAETFAITPFVEWYDSWGNLITRAFARTATAGTAGTPSNYVYDGFVTDPGGSLSGRATDAGAETWTVEAGGFLLDGAGSVYPSVSGAQSLAVVSGPSSATQALTFTGEPTTGFDLGLIFWYASTTQYWHAGMSGLWYNNGGTWSEAAAYTTPFSVGDRIYVVTNYSTPSVTVYRNAIQSYDSSTGNGEVASVTTAIGSTIPSTMVPTSATSSTGIASEEV